MSLFLYPCAPHAYFLCIAGPPSLTFSHLFCSFDRKSSSTHGFKSHVFITTILHGYPWSCLYDSTQTEASNSQMSPLLAPAYKISCIQSDIKLAGQRPCFLTWIILEYSIFENETKWMPWEGTNNSKICTDRIKNKPRHIYSYNKFWNRVSLKNGWSNKQSWSCTIRV